MKKLLNTLYVTNPDALVRKKNDALSLSVDGKQMMSVPFHLLEGMVLFGHVGCSMAVLSACAQNGIGVVLLDERGRFAARVEGPTSGNILLRREQFALASDCDRCLMVARRFVIAKLHNARVVLQHYARDYPDVADVLRPVIAGLQERKKLATSARDLDELRGIEGDAAHLYFSVFGILLRDGSGAVFEGRSKRPPRDPVNTVLSFFYTMLAREIATACEAVGLDPQMGYLHACRPGRASLSLDLIEELRAPFVDRFTLTLFNRKQLTMSDFHQEGEGCFFTDAAFKKVLGLWQEKKREQFMHPYLKERIPLGLLPFVQAQLFARYLRGNLDDYPACLWR